MEPGRARVFRLVTPHAKFVYLFLAMLLCFGVGAVLDATLGEWAVQLGSAPVLLVVVGVAVRTFRDPDVEPYEAPREWWRMTARPASGFVLGGLFLAQAAWLVWSMVLSPQLWPLLLGVATQTALGVLFVRSSLRLRAR